MSFASANHISPELIHIEYVIMRDHATMKHRDEQSEKYKLHCRVVRMVSNSFKTHRNVISEYFTCVVSVFPKKVYFIHHSRMVAHARSCICLR